MTSMRWVIRGLGLISTSILARLLTPADFGLVAMASAFSGLVAVLTQLGVDTALARDKHAGPAQFNTAWTLRQMQMLGVALLVLVFSSLAASYYREPRIENILWVTALTIAVTGFENIGVVDFRRQMQFNKDFLYNVMVKLSGVSVTIVLAFMFRNYWAMVIGSLISAFSKTILSYVMHPYRPRWSLAAFKELWSISQWLLVRGLADALYKKGGVLVLGRFAQASILGVFSVGRDLADMTAEELVAPIFRTFIPGMSQLIDQPKRLRSAFAKALAGVATIGFPITIGLGLVAGEVVPLLLGNQWHDTIPVIRVLSVASFLVTVGGPLGMVCLLLRDVRYLAARRWLSAIILVAGAAPAFHYQGIVGLSLLLPLTSMIELVANALRAKKLLGISALNLFGGLLRPVVGTLVMALAVLGVQSVLSAETSIERALLLATETAAGAVAYMVTVLSIWYFSAMPDGFERHTVSYAKEIWMKVSGRLHA